ncbi:MAG TPA: hypothetical protein VGM17_00860 [Rhizomicrobium sp.]|jgi:hypothetical protein
MALQPDEYDFLSNFSAMGAIVLGAVLATLGGLAATQIEWQFERARRERHAALFFGEVLSTIAAILALAKRVKGRGDPYGPITLRMLRQVQREITLYDRNRENLYNIRHAQLRARIHTLVLRISNPLDGILDVTAEIVALDAQLRAGPLTPEDRAQIEARIKGFSEMRESGFEFIEETAEQIAPLLKDLETVAKHTFASTGGSLSGI